jgi:UDP-4-amino-4,6-dideoxy-N-acetyl-beta-L-altrosamine transaminase
LVPYSRQKIFKEDIDIVKKVLKSNFLTTGPQVDLFEEELQKKFKSKYVTCVNSATSGLHLACMALGLTKGDYLWTSGISFVASSNCALYCGSNVDFVDIDIQSFNICVSNLKQKLTLAKKQKKLPKILVVVHMGGNPCEMEEIYKLSIQYNFKIIEDASHAAGSYYKKQIIGNCRYSDICVFSFHPVKIFTSGEGGAILTNNKKISQKLNLLRSHGIERNYKKFKKKKQLGYYYEQQLLGYNYRISDIQAALGNSQLKKIKLFTKKRNFIYNFYKKKLKNFSIKFQIIKKNNFSSFHLVIILFKSQKIRNKIFNHLRKKNYFVNLHYIPIYRHPFYKKYKIDFHAYPNCEDYYKRALSIPVYYDLKIQDLNNFIKQLEKFI